MKDETLRNMKFDMITDYDYARRYNSRIKRIRELLNNENVKEYIELVGAHPYSSVLKNDDIEKLFLNSFNRHLNDIDEKDTNKIFVYMGTFYVRYNGGFLRSALEFQVNRDDPRAEYRKYHDLEQNHSLNIPIAKCDEFERDNDIIYNNSGRFYDIRREFADDLLLEGQEKAKSYILKKYKDK